MFRRILLRFLNGFSYSIAITLTAQLLVTLISGRPPLLPEYAARFASPVSAFALQLLLIGLMSGVTSAGTVILEAGRIGMVAQSLLFLALLLAVWIPVSCYAWGFHRYPLSMVTTLASVLVTFGVCRAIQYAHCRRDIAVINELLSETEAE